MLGELKQKDNETAFEYKVRICLMKLNKEINLDWYEIVELLGLACSSDHLRKLAYAYKEYHDYMQEHPNTDSTEEHIAKINEKIRELEITKIQVADEKRMYKQVLREEARRRAILDTILNKIEELNNCKPMINKNIVHINSDKVMCVLLSDLHYGAAFDTFLNSYNSEIAKERINKYKDAIINLYNTNSPKVINIELLGDLIENALHVTARLDTDKDIGRQIIEASELISEFIFEIAEHTKVPIKIYMVEGNHDRVTIKKEEALTGESFTGVMKEIIKLRLSRVDNVSFKIEKGEFVAIVGQSGSGKSTCMNIIGALDVPTSGEYLLNGKDVSHYTDNQLAEIRNQTLGFIFQQYNLIAKLNVYENVELPLLYRNMTAEERKKRVMESLEKVGLKERVHHMPNQLSGGQQQRVSIARALATHPSIILADEPTGALDSKTGHEVLEFLKQLNNEGNTIVLITHDLGIAAEAKRIIRIQDGKVISDKCA